MGAATVTGGAAATGTGFVTGAGGVVWVTAVFVIVIPGGVIAG
jgi:hypothetical protein